VLRGSLAQFTTEQKHGVLQSPRGEKGVGLYACGSKVVTQPSIVWLHRDATWPLRRFPNMQQPTRFQDDAGHKAP
jgi:hypothetical protein